MHLQEQGLLPSTSGLIQIRPKTLLKSIQRVFILQLCPSSVDLLAFSPFSTFFVSSVLTSPFLFPSVNINTGLVFSLQMSALEGLTTHAVRHARHISPCTRGPFFACTAQEKLTDKYFDFCSLFNFLRITLTATCNTN